MNATPLPLRVRVPRLGTDSIRSSPLGLRPILTTQTTIPLSLSKSHNSDNRPLSLPDDADGQVALPFRLSGSQKKTAFALRYNIDRMISGDAHRRLAWRDIEGTQKRVWVTDGAENLHCCGFLTLTIGDWKTDLAGKRFEQVENAAEASRRINNLNRRVLSLIFSRSVIVSERHKNGAIHFHVVGILASRADIRSGFDFEAFRSIRATGKKFSAADVGASAELAALWKLLREKLPSYGFGRAELTPIEKTGEAVASYVAKYIEKNICNRLESDKRKKLVRYNGWDKSQLKPNDFSWGTARSTAWRTRARNLAALVGIHDKEQMAEAFGPRWGFYTTQLMNRVAPWKEGDPANIVWESYATRDVVRMDLVRMSKGFAQRMDRTRRPFWDWDEPAYGECRAWN